MRLKAKDSFHTSGLGAIHARSEFEVHDALGQELVDKGLAEVIEASTDTDAGAVSSDPAAAKTEPLPDNKMQAPPVNKGGRPRKNPVEPDKAKEE